MVLSSIGTIPDRHFDAEHTGMVSRTVLLSTHTLIAAAFYLLCGWITSQRGAFKDHFNIARK